MEKGIGETELASFAEKTWGNCENIVAYSLNFVQMCYGYDSDSLEKYYKSVCPHYNDLSFQINDFEYPKSGFSKKDYYILDSYDYGVSEKLRLDMIQFGVSENNFRPIYNRDHSIILGWQIEPTHQLFPTYIENGMEKKCICEYCNFCTYELRSEFEDKYHNSYNGLGLPDFISSKALAELNEYGIAVTGDKHSVYISLRLYDFLLEKYPRIECRPVILGSMNDYIAKLDL